MTEAGDGGWRQRLVEKLVSERLAARLLERLVARLVAKADDDVSTLKNSILLLCTYHDTREGGRSLSIPRYTSQPRENVRGWRRWIWFTSGIN